MIVLDLTHTSHTLAATGIQQVSRNLFAQLRVLGPAEAILRDPWQNSWRAATPSETERALPSEEDGGARRKGEAWRFSDKLRGRLRFFAGVKGPLPVGVQAAIFPEFTMERCLAALPELRASLPPGTPVVAVFHDAIALRRPELSAKKTVERLPRYVAALARFDAVAAVSEASTADLASLWKNMGIADVPPLVAIPLGVAHMPRAARKRSPGPLRSLCVSTLEPRKNHAALFLAAETLWREGTEFRLDLVGMEHRELGSPIVAAIRRLQAEGRPLFWHGAVDGATLRQLYAECDFSVYPSLDEGFGLPVLESLASGRPCVLSPGGALAELAEGGGCLLLPDASAASVEMGLRAVLTEATLLETLSAEAAARPVRTWADYARDLRDFALSAKARG